VKNKTVKQVLIIFQDRPPFNSEGLGESFPFMWLDVGFEKNIKNMYFFCLRFTP